MVKSLLLAGAVGLGALGLGGCEASFGVEPAYVEVETPPVVEVESRPHFTWHSREVYYVNSRWYYKTGGRWRYYSSEPEELRRERVRRRW